MGRNPHDFTQRQQTVSATLGRKHFLGGRFAAARVQAGPFCDTASVFRIFRQMGGAQITAGEAFRAPKGGPRGIRNAIFALEFSEFRPPRGAEGPPGVGRPLHGNAHFCEGIPFFRPPGGRPPGRNRTPLGGPKVSRARVLGTFRPGRRNRFAQRHSGAGGGAGGPPGHAGPARVGAPEQKSSVAADSSVRECFWGKILGKTPSGIAGNYRVHFLVLDPAFARDPPAKRLFSQ